MEIQTQIATMITNQELAAWTRASFTAIAITEIIKRGVRLAKRDISAECLWAISLILAGILGVVELSDTPDRVNKIWMLIPVVMVSTPITHWVFVSNGATLLQFMVKRFTGFELNIKALATGREYLPRAHKPDNG